VLLLPRRREVVVPQHHRRRASRAGAHLREGGGEVIRVFDVDDVLPVDAGETGALAVAHALLGDGEVEADLALADLRQLDGVLLGCGESGCVGHLHEGRRESDGGLRSECVVRAGVRVEVVELDRLEAVACASADRGGEAGDQLCAVGARGNVEDVLVGPAGVGDRLAVLAHQQVGGPAGAGLALESVDVADVVQAGRGFGGAIAGDDLDIRCRGVRAAELVVGDADRGELDASGEGQREECAEKIHWSTVKPRVPC